MWASIVKPALPLLNVGRHIVRGILLYCQMLCSKSGEINAKKNSTIVQLLGEMSEFLSAQSSLAELGSY